VWRAWTRGVKDEGSGMWYGQERVGSRQSRCTRKGCGSRRVLQGQGEQCKVRGGIAGAINV